MIFALVLLFSVLFNTLYTFIDIGSPWTSQYTNVTPRILMAVGALPAACCSTCTGRVTRASSCSG